jgi:hypothetical protein
MFWALSEAVAVRARKVRKVRKVSEVRRLVAFFIGG